jgi:hypothetical protein
MTSNFKIEQNYALIFEGRHIDLHNNFDFIGYEYNTAGRKLVLKWTKSEGDWVKHDELDNLQLIHFNVSYLVIYYDNKKYEFPNGDNCLSNISFYPSEDRQTNDTVFMQEDPKETDDINYMFQTEGYIRVSCDMIQLICH